MEKSSFLESISPWNLSRSTTPKPPIDRVQKDAHEALQQGGDHTVSGRPRLSLRQYPKDCPKLQARWFYAVDTPKRKPTLLSQSSGEDKPRPIPKKFVAFSARDSQAIENSFQKAADDQEDGSSQDKEGDISDARSGSNSRKERETVTVPVNEDYLFDVDIKERELRPAYWLGPTYEVRRGTWFFQEGSALRPCDENLATQLEEGYLKVKPWTNMPQQPQRAASQSRGRPSSMRLAKDIKLFPDGTPSAPGTPKAKAADDQTLSPTTTQAGPVQTHRLFGTYMNSTVTYQDASTAWMANDDFMSRMSSTVYQTFGSVGGAKLVRGYIEAGKSKESADGKSNTEETSGATREDRIKGPLGNQDGSSTPIQKKAASSDSSSPAPQDHEAEEKASRSRRHESEAKMAKLERQMSSLEEEPESTDQAEEDASKEEEKEMEEFYQEDGDDQNREIEHLVLITHGIGQRLGLRLDSINFVHDVNVLRKTLKAVYNSAPDLQALNAQVDQLPKNCRIQVLPVCWRHLLDFPKQSLKQNRKELDLTEADNYDEDYPNLADITVDGVPAVRNLITDLAMDVLLYQSAYREHIAGIVQRESNRIYQLFKQRHPTFSGRVSLIGHSLGSAIFFDLLCRQKGSKQTASSRPLRHYSKSSKNSVTLEDSTELKLDFDCENLFCLGSPIALFQMLKGRKIAARDNENAKPAESPFDPESADDPFFSPTATNQGHSRDILPLTVSSPKCGNIYNIFHPTDPISYRIEPLISPAMASMKPQPLPYTKKGLFGAQGISARVSQGVGTFWSSFTSGVASSLLNRSLGITGEEQALPVQAKGPLQTQSSKQRLSTDPGKALGEDATTSVPTVVSDAQKRQIAEDTAKAGKIGQDHLPTLIDSDMETLYAGFEKRRRSHQSDGSRDVSASADWEDAEERAKKLKREEAKVRALNSNGRVDYAIQEGVFDISILASIASHLSYWADEDVGHFMISQLLSKGRPKPR